MPSVARTYLAPCPLELILCCSTIYFVIEVGNGPNLTIVGDLFENSFFSDDLTLPVPLLIDLQTPLYVSHPCEELSDRQDRRGPLFGFL